MSEIILLNGTGHDGEFKTKTGKVKFSDLQEAEQVRTTAEVARQTCVQVEVGNKTVELPLFQIEFWGLSTKQRARLGGLAVNQVVLTSRLGERGAMKSGINRGFSHPAYMDRVDLRADIANARYAAVPTKTPYRKSSIMTSTAQLNRESYRLVNASPGDLYLQTNDGLLLVPRDRRHPPIGVEYDYTPLGQTPEGIAIVTSAPKTMHGQQKVEPTTLVLVHSEVPVVARQLNAVNAATHQQFVVPWGTQRLDDGRQGDVFTGLMQYGPDTLERFAEIGI